MFFFSLVVFLCWECKNCTSLNVMLPLRECEVEFTCRPIRRDAAWSKRMMSPARERDWERGDSAERSAEIVLSETVSSWNLKPDKASRKTLIFLWTELYFVSWVILSYFWVFFNMNTAMTQTEFITAWKMASLPANLNCKWNHRTISADSLLVFPGRRKNNLWVNKHQTLLFSSFVLFCSIRWKEAWIDASNVSFSFGRLFNTTVGLDCCILLIRVWTIVFFFSETGNIIWKSITEFIDVLNCIHTNSWIVFFFSFQYLYCFNLKIRFIGWNIWNVRFFFFFAE